MKPLRGVISDRLRRLFAGDDPAWNPGRPASPTKAKPVPKHVEGHQLGGRKGRRK